MAVNSEIVKASVAVIIGGSAEVYAPAYLYGGVTDTGRRETTSFLKHPVAIWEATSVALAQQQADRLASGLIGARMCCGEEEIQAFLAEL